LREKRGESAIGNQKVLMFKSDILVLLAQKTGKLMLRWERREFGSRCE
jgi:hypothetical protein